MELYFEEPRIRIHIVGIGGGGNNAINRMVEQNIPMVNYISLNTDDGAFQRSKADKRLQIGLQKTKGYGAGSNPEVGRLSAEEDAKAIEEAIKGCDLLFITSGMGGGTGTGAAPVVAEIARKLGILTVAVVTKPFFFEGKRRIEQANMGIESLSEIVDALIVIPNDNLKHVSAEKITLNNAFEIADDVLVQTVKNIVEVIQKTAFINCDFADIRSVLQNSGRMHTATGIIEGAGRTEDLIRQIRSSALLGSSVENANGILLFVVATDDTPLEEVEQITSAVADLADPDANIIFGMNFSSEDNNELRAVLLATHRMRK